MVSIFYCLCWQITEELVKDIHDKFQARQDLRGGLKEGGDSPPEEPQQSNQERPFSNNQLLLELEREKSKVDIVY